MYCDWGTKPVVVSCLFRENHVSSGGGLMVAGSAEVTLIDCVFSENTAGVFGGAIAGSTGPEIHAIGCRFEGNRAAAPGGAVMGTVGCTYVFIESEFIRNVTLGDGGGLYNSGGPTTLINCRFSDNSAQGYGGGVHGQSAKVDLVNCLFVGNRAENPLGAGGARSGGALSNQHGTLTATNCTFADNVAERSGGGFYHGVWSTTSTLTNCVFWNNRDEGGSDENAQIFIDPAAAAPPAVTYSLIQGFTVDGPFNRDDSFLNVGDDPKFVDAANRDFHLQSISPAINLGNNTAVPPDTFDLDGDDHRIESTPFDLDGQPRFDGCVIDLGAFETTGAPLVRIVPADLDGDCDVDTADLEVFIDCATGASVAYGPGDLPATCRLPLDAQDLIAADLDQDHDVDQTDFAVIQRCLSGENNPADTNCAN